MEIDIEKPLHARLSKTQDATTIAGIIFTLVAIFCFIIGLVCIMKSSQVAFLSEFYMIMAVFLFLLTALFIIPGLLFLKFGQSSMVHKSGTVINYRFGTLRNTFIILCFMFGIAAIISFSTGAFVFLEEFSRYLRQF